MGKTIVISARKGGVGKSATTVSLGTGLARNEKKVLIIDTDSQASATISLGVKEPDKLSFTLTNAMANILEETDFDPATEIIHTAEGVDLMPASSNLAGMELALTKQLLGRETILRQYIERVKPLYDWVLIDTSPNLDLITINALAAADSVIIPVVPKFLDAKGLELLLKSIAQIRRQINPTLEIGGILLTMVDKRANFTRDIISLVENAYGGNIRIFDEHIPISIRAAESTAQGVSIFTHDLKGKVAAAYSALVREVLQIA